MRRAAIVADGGFGYVVSPGVIACSRTRLDGPGSRFESFGTHAISSGDDST
jgi:hypothetical protein